MHEGDNPLSFDEFNLLSSLTDVAIGIYEVIDRVLIARHSVM
jgi:hypothetical protein